MTNSLNIVEVDDATKGAACMALLARKYIDNFDQLMIADCDQYIDININQDLTQLNPEMVGLIMTMTETSPKWSYKELNDLNQIKCVV